MLGGMPSISLSVVEKIIGIGIGIGGLQYWNLAFAYLDLPAFPIVAAGLFLAKVASYLFLMAGAVCLVLGLSPRYWLTYIGSVLSYFGVVWSFVPFLPNAFSDTSSLMYAVIAVNVSVIAVLVALQIRGHVSRQAKHAD